MRQARRRREFILPQVRQVPETFFFVFWFTHPSEKPLRQNNSIVQCSCTSLSRKLCTQLIDNSARNGRFFFLGGGDRQLFSLALRLKQLKSILTFKNNSSFQISSLLSLASRGKPCQTRLRVFACLPTCVPHKQAQVQPEHVRRSTSCLGYCVHAKCHNVTHQPPLLFALHKPSRTPVKSITEATSDKMHLRSDSVRDLPHIASHFFSNLEFLERNFVHKRGFPSRALKPYGSEKFGTNYTEERPASNSEFRVKQSCVSRSWK